MLIAFFVRYWRVLAGAAVAAVLLAWISNKVNGALEDAERRGFELCRSQATAAAAEAEKATLEREADQRELNRTTDIHWQEVQRDLQSRVDQLTAARSVDLGRLRECASARAPGADPSAGGAAAAAEPDGGAGQRGHDLQAQPDLGIELVRYAGECEGYRRQVSELQSWISATH
jgi:hypothetical protein